MSRMSSGAIAVVMIIALAFVMGFAGGAMVASVAGSPAESAGAAAGSADPTASGAAQPPADYVGTIHVAPDDGPIGSDVTVEGSGFDPSADLDIVWQAFSGRWVIDNTAPAGANYGGRTYAEEWQPVSTVTTDASGSFTTTFAVPDGFGFTHNVQVRQGGTVRNQTSFSVSMEVSVTPTSGPHGTPIQVDVRGIGVSPLHSSWELTYDDHFTGWMSAVTTHGHARFTIPATGAPGPHVLKILHGSFTFPYLNMQQSPDPDRPTFTSIFTVTDGEPIVPPEPAAQWQPVVGGAPPADASGPTTWTDPVETVVGHHVVLHGRDLPAGKTVTVRWQTQVGVDTAIIGGTGTDRPTADWELGTATIAGDGTLSWEFEVPADKGGWHELRLLDGDETVASTEVRVRPAADALPPGPFEVGDVLTLHVTGVDDTDTGKILMLVYDNAMLGYSCSVTGQGDITIHMPAAGTPGWHYLVLYPGIYKGSDAPGVYNYRIPQLTWADDHPNEQLTAFAFAFEIAPS